MTRGVGVVGRDLGADVAVLPGRGVAEAGQGDAPKADGDDDRGVAGRRAEPV